MNLHEYQARELLREYGVPTPLFMVVEDPAQIGAVQERLSLEKAIIKAQVHAGGRGKAGGVVFAEGKEEILSKATSLLGKRLVTKQTGPEGAPVHTVSIGPVTSIEKEYYLAVTIDRKKGVATLIASTEGGVEIEEVASKHPEKILKLPIHGALRSYQLLTLAKFMRWEKGHAEKGAIIAKGLVRAFFELDALLIEINPLVLTKEGILEAIDAKVTIDESASFRQKKLFSEYDTRQLPERELQAKKANLQYIALEGNIGCMVNGAGLAMATMDIIDYYGGAPANFLDVGGGADKEKVALGFKIILEDKNVRAILVNIFGGIMDCKVLAEGIESAAREATISVPLIVRLEGTNKEKGQEILKKSGLTIHLAKDLKEAAELACKMAAEGGV